MTDLMAKLDANIRNDTTPIICRVSSRTRQAKALYESVGTGVVLSSAGHVITAAHCLPIGLELEVAIHAADGDYYKAVQLVRWEPHDLVLVKCVTKEQTFSCVQEMDDIDIVTTVYHLGYPLVVDDSYGEEFFEVFKAIPPTFSRGYVTHTVPTLPDFLGEYHSFPNNSGGVLISAYGRFLGMHKHQLFAAREDLKSAGLAASEVNVKFGLMKRKRTQERRVKTENKDEDVNEDKTLEVSESGDEEMTAAELGEVPNQAKRLSGGSTSSSSSSIRSDVKKKSFYGVALRAITILQLLEVAANKYPELKLGESIPILVKRERTDRMRRMSEREWGEI